MKLTILGCNSATPKPDRHTTSQLLNIDEQYILLDCGEATQIRLEEYGFSHFRIHTIFISHLHGDHYFGLIGLLNSMGLAGREKSLRLIAPVGLKAIIEAHMAPLSSNGFPFPIEYIELPDALNGALDISSKIKAYYFPTKHSIPCHGIRIEVDKPKLRILPEKAKELGVPDVYLGQIKNGEDYKREDGRVISYKELTEPIAFTNYSYAFTADTMYYPEMLEYIEGVHTLYHESTYASDRASRAKDYMHSTATQAADMAREAGAERLILGHYSSAYKDTEIFEKEAREIFPNTHCSFDGMEIKWPPE